MDLDTHLPAILAGDTRAFGQWMARAEGPIRDSLRGFAAAIDAEAVLQEALLRVWQVAPRFVADGRPNGLLRLGLRIARNLAVSEVRRTRARPTEPEDLEKALDTGGPAPTAPDPLLRQVIASCRDALPEQPRRALDARLEGGGRDEDLALASALGMRVNTFLQNFTRARRMLAECLRKHGVVVEEELGA